MLVTQMNIDYIIFKDLKFQGVYPILISAPVNTKLFKSILFTFLYPMKNTDTCVILRYLLINVYTVSFALCSFESIK